MQEQTKDIGQKIRALRLRRGMTQSALAGNSVTRNMLSLIENGSAAPSLHTLVDLSRRLDVPVGYFFADSEAETSQFTKMGMITELHRLFADGEYEACLASAGELPCPDDEIRLLCMLCHFALAERALENCALTTAADCLKRVVSEAEFCIYTPAGLLSTVDYISRLIHAAGQEDVPPTLASVTSFPGAWIPAEFLLYMRALTALSANDTTTVRIFLESGLIASSVYLDFLEAKIALANGATEKAFPLLKKILNASDLRFFTRYHVLTALESCAGAAGDFKAAYQYSAQKVHLLERFAQ